MIGKAIQNVEVLERQVSGKTREQLNARIAIRVCLAELRSIAADAGTSIVPDQDAAGAKVIAFSARAAS
jgi:hypothetical protein